MTLFFSITDARPIFLVRVLLIPSTMLPEVFFFLGFSLQILLANETSAIAFTVNTCSHAVFLGRGAAAQESARVLRILHYKIKWSLSPLSHSRWACQEVVDELFFPLCLSVLDVDRYMPCQGIVERVCLALC